MNAIESFLLMDTLTKEYDLFLKSFATADNDVAYEQLVKNLLEKGKITYSANSGNGFNISYKMTIEERKLLFDILSYPEPFISQLLSAHITKDLYVFEFMRAHDLVLEKFDYMSPESENLKIYFTRKRTM